MKSIVLCFIFHITYTICVPVPQGGGDLIESVDADIPCELPKYMLFLGKFYQSLKERHSERRSLNRIVVNSNVILFRFQQMYISTGCCDNFFFRNLLIIDQYFKNILSFIRLIQIVSKTTFVLFFSRQSEAHFWLWYLTQIYGTTSMQYCFNGRKLPDGKWIQCLTKTWIYLTP